MQSERHDLSPGELKRVGEIVADPVLFARHVLGARLWRGEIELLRSIKLCRRTAVRACHGAGKTYTLACGALWWLAAHPDGIVLTTSPTFRQVKTQLWAEMHKAMARSRLRFPPANDTCVKLRGDDNFALGLSTNQADNFQGYHGKNLLIIADEAPGIESGIWDAIAGAMAGGKVHIVMAGNPTIPAGAFYDAFTRERELWNCIAIDALESPNLAGLTLKQLLQMDPRAGGPLDENPIPYLVTRRWVYDQHHSWWHGDEASSPNWVARVRGRFPEQAHNALMKLLWLERARERAQQAAAGLGGGRLVAGIDVGGGEAETVVYLCECEGERRKIVALGAWRAADTRGQAARFLEPYRGRLTSVRVDSIGIGYNFALHLRDQGLPVELINVSRPCGSRPQLRENDPAARFANDKARFYQTLADAFERDQIDGLSDETTLAQLAGILYEIDSHGRIRIEPKEKARERGLASPDRAEALMLALGEPVQPFEWTPAQQAEPALSYEQRYFAQRFAEDSALPRKSRRFGPGRGF
jgi:phage terminase large subunit